MTRKQNRRDPTEQEAVRTTIVGARPPGSGKSRGNIPRGIEVLVKKASVDIRFKELLMRERAKAAHEIGLSLDPAEAMIVNCVPTSQLEAIISRARVSQKSRAAFLGRAAAVMLAALGTATLGTSCAGGCRADEPELNESEAEPPASENATQDTEP